MRHVRASTDKSGWEPGGSDKSETAQDAEFKNSVRAAYAKATGNEAAVDTQGHSEEWTLGCH